MQNDSIDNLRLDLNKKSVRGVIYVRSGDTRARTIHITLTNNGTVVDLADAVICELLILKPDGGMNDQTMVRYGNELQYTFRTADINVPGECKCQVMVTFSDSAVVTSSEFSVMVYQKEVDQELEKSTNEYTAITEILVEVQDLKNQADQDADRAETARTSIEGSEEACRQYAESAALDATSASESATSAESSAENAETSASNAQSYAESAETNMIETRENLAAVEEKAEEILGYDSSAQQSAEDAAASATAASASETSASNYANASQTSAGNSANSALDSEAWAKGTRSGSDIPATDPAYNNHSKYWAEKAQEAATSFPTHLSSFVNDTGFIDNTVNDLVNYYTQSQTYTQAEVNALIAAINEMNIEVVSSLPTEDIDTHTIYFVTKQDPQTGDYYEEYIYINNAWEHIGNTQVDLSSYYTKTETDTLLSAKVADNPAFTEASTRTNIASGETFATILGKIKKFFTDLKDLAFIAKDGSTSKYLRGDGTWQAFPTIPAAQVNSDWNASSGVAQILNKPTIPDTTDLYDNHTDKYVHALTSSDNINNLFTLGTYYAASGNRPSGGPSGAPDATTSIRVEFNRAGSIYIQTWEVYISGNIYTYKRRYYNSWGAWQRYYNSALDTIPTSLPANGGNADTVDGLHAWYLQSVQTNGTPYNTGEYLLRSRFNPYGDLNFALEIYNNNSDTSVYGITVAKSRSVSATSQYRNGGNDPTACPIYIAGEGTSNRPAIGFYQPGASYSCILYMAGDGSLYARWNDGTEKKIIGH